MADNRTLDEVKVDHQDNFADILSECTNKVFPSAVYAYQYRMHSVEQAFRQLGFSPQDFITNATSTDTAIDLIDQAMCSRNMRVEDWSEHADRDRRGMYIYKDNEIAYFIALVRKAGDNFIVKSNVKFE